MPDVLVVNAGSTSVKLRLVAPDESTRTLDGLEDVDATALEAVAHRVVHGGARFREPVLVDEGVRDEVFALAEVAPLHNPPALRGIEEAERRFPDVPQIAVFDTAFHATIPPEAATYAVPRSWREEWGIRRYGFHGLSVAWCAGRVPELLGRQADELRLIVCHLGGGCSVTAVRGGRSIDTTMGFTPIEGVPMATRSGSVDPGALLYLLRKRGVSPEELDHALNEASGLEALGGPATVRELALRAAAGDGEAGLAIDVFTYRVAGAVAAMAVAAGGIDAVAFTAGIGEGSAFVRRRVCERIAFLGLELDEAANERSAPDADVASPGSAVRAVVVAAREEIVAARAARSLLRSRLEG